MDSNYRFVNLIDPSKCSAKIKEKFAKLTLSSNKKNQDASEMPQEIQQKIVSKRISRNLLSELLTDDESDQDDHVQEKPTTGNLLMRTDSSSTIANEETTRNPNLIDATDATHCSQIEHEAEKSMEMEPLVVSCLENTEQFEEEIEKLSSRVSSMAVTEGPPITINSEVNPLNVSRIVSTEHHRMCSGQVNSPVKLRAEVKREPDVSICISSSSDDDDADSDAPITISDSSDNELEDQPRQQKQKQEQEEEIEPNVSSIIVAPSSSQNMSTAKANQMAAFLRDVRKNYGYPVALPDRDFFDTRQREIATADTEPMTAENDSRSAGTAHRIATADTESMTEATEKEPSPDSNRRLALDDTEDMTKANESMQSSRHYVPVVKASSELLEASFQKISDPIPDDSLTIAETSEEDECKSDDEEPQAVPIPSGETSNALKRSESFSQIRSRNSSSVSSGDTQVQINFSAKINIKIQYSQQTEHSSSSEIFTDSSQSNEKSVNESIEEEHPHNSAHKASNSQSRNFEDIPHSPPERDVPQPQSEVPETPVVEFIDKAQQLLNELYGDQWMTPQVLRSLKKVPISSKRTARPAATKRTAVKPDDAAVPIELESRSSMPAAPPPKPESKLEPQKSQLELTKSSLEANEESVLGDFSIFRRNIPQELDSTRLPLTPLPHFKEPNQMTPIPRTVRRQPKATIAQPPKPAAVEVVKTRSGREVRHNWRNMIDSDTESEEGAAASDDSERSWEKAQEINTESEEEKEASPPNDSEKPKTSKTKQEIDGKEEIENKKPKTTRGKKKNEIVYLDLSKDEVEIQHNASASPPANNDAKFNSRLNEILASCRYEDKPKLGTPGSKSKRKLFSVQLNEDFDNVVAPFDSPKERNINNDNENVSISGARMPAKFEPFNKYLESVKTGKPIFKIRTPKKTLEENPIEEATSLPKTPKSAKKELRVIKEISKTPRDKYGFLKSLDVCVGKSNCHPDALYYRDNFRVKREELATKLYEIFNSQCFNDAISVPLVWNKKLTNTAGRCMNKKRLGERTCVIELSDKVLTSADRLRCTLIHELCHAATWILNGESGHGATWKAWARKANQVFPELPKIGVCHQYDIEYKYTYKCTLCGAKSHAHSKSKKVENIRCSYCHGAIEVYLNKKDKEGNTMLTPVKEPTGFAKFVKDKYKQFKRPDLKHADVMKLLSNEFASMKVDGKS